MLIYKAQKSDAEEILKLQKLAFFDHIKLYHDPFLPMLIQTVEEVIEEMNYKTIFKLVIDNIILGSIRAYINENKCYISTLCVLPNYQNKGIGSKLLKQIETYFKCVESYELFTGSKNIGNLYLYQKSGYEIYNTVKINNIYDLIYLKKLNLK